MARARRRQAPVRLHWVLLRSSAVLLWSCYQVAVSRETVRRWLRQADLVWRRPRPVLCRQGVEASMVAREERGQQDQKGVGPLLDRSRKGAFVLVGRLVLLQRVELHP